MQYFGGKARVGKQIAEYLVSVQEGRNHFVEPFVGGAWVTQWITDVYSSVEASDSCSDLIMLYKDLQLGWIPPSTISELEYQRLRHTESSGLRAFAGFGCSWGGKWFGGYARSNRERNYASNARNSLLKKFSRLRSVDFSCKLFESISCSGAVIYCDPPYSGTTGYDANENSFDWTSFWEKVRQLSEKNRVIVSEYKAPSDFLCVKQFLTRTDVRVSSGNMSLRTEKLFEINRAS